MSIRNLIVALSLLAFSSVSLALDVTHPGWLHEDKGPGDRQQRIQLWGTIELKADGEAGDALHGLSGLAWDGRHLHAVSDFGVLLKLAPKLEGQRLSGVELIAWTPLKDASGRALEGREADAEGLAWVGGPHPLCVSFERRPRVICYDEQGRPGPIQPLPEPLNDIGHYRRANDALETLFLLPGTGLVTAPERWPDGRLPVMALEGEGGPWRHVLPPDTGCGLTAMEPLGGDQVLILERCFDPLFRELLIYLRAGHLGSDKELAVTELARFDGSDGWLMDNFEGLTALGNDRYFMISDDNRNFLQRTLLVLFQVLPPTNND